MVKRIKFDDLEKLKNYFQNVNTRGRSAVLRYCFYEGMTIEEMEKVFSIPKDCIISDMNSCNDYRIIPLNDKKNISFILCQMNRTVESF